MLAAMNGHVAAVKLLLDRGSDVNAQVCDHTPLYFVKPQSPFCKFLLDCPSIPPVFPTGCLWHIMMIMFKLQSPYPPTHHKNV